MPAIFNNFLALLQVRLKNFVKNIWNRLGSELWESDLHNERALLKTSKRYIENCWTTNCCEAVKPMKYETNCAE